MRLLAPAGSLNSVVKVLEAGADDIYFGARSPYLNNYSFNGRALLSRNGERILAEPGQIKDIVDSAHGYGAGVNYLANIPFFHDDPNNNGSLAKALEEYLLAGIDAGVDAVVAGDLGLLRFIRRLNKSIPIAASSYLEVQNANALELMEELGVSRVILSYQSKLDEIVQITHRSNIEIEVFGHGGCSFYVGSCNLFHEAGECTGTGFRVGYPCRGIYTVSVNGRINGNNRFLDGFKMCSLCQLKELADANVYALKIVGRDLDPDFISQVVNIYRKGIDYAADGYDISLLRDNLVPVWWKKMWCENGIRCRYM